MNNFVLMSSEMTKAEEMLLLHVGGNANNGSQCGVSYANSNNGFANANANIGARLEF